MHIAFNILKWILCQIVSYFFPRNYEVSRVYLNYTRDLAKCYQKKKTQQACRESRRIKFWKEEDVYNDQTTYTADVTDEFTSPGRLRRILRRVPDDVTDHNIIVKYNYNGKIYKTIFYNPRDTVEWPPKNTYVGMVFNLPILKAYLIGADDDSYLDVTKKIQRFAGPKHDFHGIPVQIRDMVYSEKYKKLKIVNILNKVRVLDINTGLLIHPLF